MPLEESIIAKLTDAYSIQVAVKRGISPDLFIVPTNQEIVKFCFEYYSRYSQPPTMKILNERFQFEYPTNIEEPIEELIEEISLRYKRNEIEQTLYKAAEKLKDDPDDSLEFLSKKIYEIFLNARDRSQTYNYVTTVAERIAEYHIRTQTKDQILGCPTGWEQYDWHTLGLSRGELGVLFAATGDGKTYTMLRMALGAYALGWSPLIIAYEPTIPMLAERLDSLVARINLRNYRLGRLTEDEYQQYYARMKTLAKYTTPFIITKPSDRTMIGVVEALKEHSYTKTDKWVIFIDQLSFMDVGEDKFQNYQKLFNQIIKSIAPDTLNVPCWLLAQENREGMRARQAKLFHIGLTSAAEQFADIVLNLDRDEMGAATLRILKNRSGPKAEFSMEMNLDRGIIEVTGYFDSSRLQFQR